jgi:hypothetical protein
MEKNSKIEEWQAGIGFGKWSEDDDWKSPITPFRGRMR